MPTLATLIDNMRNWRLDSDDVVSYLNPPTPVIQVGPKIQEPVKESTEIAMDRLKSAGSTGNVEIKTVRGVSSVCNFCLCLFIFLFLTFTDILFMMFWCNSKKYTILSPNCHKLFQLSIILDLKFFFRVGASIFCVPGWFQEYSEMKQQM